MMKLENEARENSNSAFLKAVTDTDQADEDEILADAGFLFDSWQPAKQVTYSFTPTLTDGDAAGRDIPIRISLECVDDDPGAVQSGHYVWPASPALAQYLVDTYYPSSCTRSPDHVSKIIELGCGCGLVGLCSYKIFPKTSRLVFTDHDPGTLKRAKSNFQATKEVGRSTMVLFEELKWCDDTSYFHDFFRRVSSLEVDGRKIDSGFDLILGSDLIYCVEVVKPLLQTVSRLLSKTNESSKMILSQSFSYDERTETEIDDVCVELKLSRSVTICTLSRNNGKEVHVLKEVRQSLRRY